MFSRVFSLLLLSLVLPLYLTELACADPTLEIEVTDVETGRGIEGVTILIIGPMNETVKTESSGKAELCLLNGSYEVEVVHSFYISETKQVTLEGDAELSIHLRRKNVTLTLSTIALLLRNSVRNATVELTGPLDGIGGWEEISYAGVTGKDGTVVFSVPAGTYSVLINASGYQGLALHDFPLTIDQSLAVLLVAEKSSVFFLSPTLIVTIGWLLGAINYYLGWVLVTAPVGHRGLRRAGWIMVEDGAAYAFMMGAFTLILLLIHFVWQVVYGPGTIAADLYNELFLYYQSNMVWAFMAIGYLFSGIAALGATIIGSAAALMLVEVLRPVFSSLMLVIELNAILFIFSAFIAHIWPSALSVGALLYGLPARVGRYAGASIMAFTVIFYLGLPYLPVFTGFATGYTRTGMETLAYVPEQYYSLYPAVNAAYEIAKSAAIHVASFYVYSFIFPLIYVIILGVIASSVARMLGGGALFRVPI